MADVEYEVWWVPQIPMQSFTVAVASIAEGKKICDVLADYDMFQFKHNVKPDYANTGGIRMRHPIGTEGDWWDVPDDEDELADIMKHCTEAA